MTFYQWLKKQGEYIDSRKVRKYLKGKKDEKAREIEIEILNAEKASGSWIWIPTDIYKDEYYLF